MLQRNLFAALVLPCLALAQEPGPTFLPGCDGVRSAELAGQGRVAIAAGHANTATTFFRQAYDACPAERRLLLELSRALSADRKPADAVSTAEEFLRSDPNSTPGLLVLANALFMAQRWEDCSPVLAKVLKAEPDNPVALLLKANNSYLLGQDGEAEQLLLRLLDKNPSDIDAAYTLGRMYYMQNRGEYAMGQFLRVVKLDPNHYKAWDNLGLCYDAAGNTDQAIRHFLSSIKLVEKDHPEYDWPYANLSDLLLRLNRYQEAYNAAFEAANRNSRAARNFFLAGQALVKLERQAEAQKWLEQAVALDGSYPDALYALGQLYMRAGEKDKAVETLKRFREAKANAPKKKR